MTLAWSGLVPKDPYKGSGVTRFNTRTGDVVLLGADVEALFTAAGQLFAGTGNGSGTLISGSNGQVPTVQADGSLAFTTPASAPSPASTVTGPDAFGDPAVVGTSLLYARQDHNHGLPAAPASGGGLFIYGDGSDGTVTFDGTTTVLGLVPSANAYTLTRDIFLKSGTINNGVTINTAGFRIFDAGTFTNNGTVQNNGGAGGNATTGTVGSAGAVAPRGTLGMSSAAGTSWPGKAGVSNAVGLTATGGASSYGGGGGNGGSATNAGGSGATVIPPAASTGSVHSLPAALGVALGFGTATGFVGGTGGGSGGSDSANAYSGGSGAGGGIVGLYAKTIAGTGTIQANGGNGGNSNGTAGNAGGSAGGGGGLVIVISTSVSGGAVTGQTIQALAGSGGAPFGTGNAAGAAASGTVVLIPG